MLQLLQKLYAWFDLYADSFMQLYPQHYGNLKLKKEHTLRVCAVIRRLVEETGCDAQVSICAEISALLHDVGRFEQYVRYETFSDAASEDHGDLAIEIITAENLLDSCEQRAAERIRFAVQCHNKALIPDSGDTIGQMIAKLLRDADKIDIWRVVTQSYLNGDSESIGSMLHLPASGAIAEKICEDIQAGNIARLEHVQNCNDLKLLQMAWVYDINFPVSFKMIEERGYIDTLYATLPDRPEVQEIYHSIKSYISSTSPTNKRRKT